MIRVMTAQQLADKLHLTRDGINLHLKAMKEATPRLIHVAAWGYNAKGGRPAPHYRPGDQADAAYMPSRAPTRHLRIDENKARILHLIESKKMTIRQLSAALNLSHQWTRHLIAELRQDGRAHIGGWQRQEAGIAPLYAVGGKRDVPKPKHTQTAWKRRMARVRFNPDARELYDNMKKRRAMREHIKKMAATPQPWFAALMTPGRREAA